MQKPEALMLFSIIDTRLNEPITEEMLAAIPVNPSMRISCSVLNGHIFSYLTLALQGNAATIMHNVDPHLGCRNGIEV